jgi:hypothetical protein
MQFWLNENIILKNKATWEIIKKLFNPTNNGRIFF